MSQAYNVVDADGHVLEPINLWEHYIDPKFLDRRHTPRAASALTVVAFVFAFLGLSPGLRRASFRSRAELARLLAPLIAPMLKRRNWMMWSWDGYS